VWNINLSVFVSVVICFYLHNFLTCNILTLCYKMSVGHICNMVLGGLENICTEWVFTCFFSIKQTVSTSCLVCLKFIFIILFYITYCIILISAVWKCQVTKFCRVVSEYEVCFMLHFWLYNFELSLDFWKICALVI